MHSKDRRPGLKPFQNGEIEVPHADLDGFYYSNRNGEVKVADDPRKLYEPGMSLDTTALFSVLQFGAIVPPLTPWKDVSRLMPGYRYSIRPGNAPQAIGALSLKTEFTISTNLDDRANQVTTVLDQVLKLDKRPIVLFSGGVDSGLIAARLAEIGKQDSLLLNFEFDDSDQESAHAQAMAEILGLPFQKVKGENCDKLACLVSPGRFFPLPFGDISVTSSAFFANAIISDFAGDQIVLVDGIGADGAFGLSAKIKLWKQLYKIPSTSSVFLSYLYKRVWLNETKSEYYVRVLRRRHSMPLLSAFLAQNALGDILYCSDELEKVIVLLDEWFSGWPLSSKTERIVAADVSFIGANIFSQKACHLFSAHNIDISYPFMSDELFGLGLHETANYADDEPKPSLKHALARSVPPHMVYRRKSGFVGASTPVIYDQRFIEYLNDTISPNAPLRDLLIPKNVNKVIDHLKGRKIIPGQLVNCIWTIVFVDRWLRTVGK